MKSKELSQTPRMTDKDLFEQAENHFHKQEFKKAAGFYVKISNSSSKFYFNYAMGEHYAYLNPPDMKNSIHFYSNAEKMLPPYDNSEYLSDLYDRLYVSWGRFYREKIKNVSIAEQYFSKGIAANGRLCQYGYALILEECGQFSKAFGLFKQASIKKVFSAEYAANRLVLLGLVKPPDSKATETALASIRRFASTSKQPELYWPAKFLLANCLFAGIGTEKKPDAATKIYQEIIADSPIIADVLSSRYNLASIFWLEKLDVHSALIHYQQAAAEGHVYSQLSLAFLHEYGIGVEASNQLTEEWLRKAAAKSEIGKEKLQEFLATQRDNEIITDLEFRQQCNELKLDKELYQREKSTIFERKIPIHDPKIEEKTTSLFFPKQLNKIILEISRDKNLYAQERIRCIFANIALAHYLDNINLVTAISEIGKLFKLIDDHPRIISKYVQQITLLLDTVCQRIQNFNAEQIVGCIDGASKLHIHPEEKSLKKLYILAMKFSLKKLLEFTPQQLSLFIHGLVMLGISSTCLWEENFPKFLQQIQNHWKKFTIEQLIALAYTFASLNIQQVPQKPRLISFRMLKQVYKNIQAALVVKSAIEDKYIHQFLLSFTYFKQSYPSSTLALPEITLPEIKEPSEAKITEFQKQVTALLSEYFPPENLKIEHPINGLPVDICLLEEKMVIRVNGPVHFVHASDIKQELTPTTKDRLQKVIIQGADYTVIDINYIDWDNLTNRSQQIALLKKQGIPLKSRPKSVATNSQHLMVKSFIKPSTRTDKTWAQIAASSSSSSSNSSSNSSASFSSGSS